MKKADKEEKLIRDCYRELFANSEPSADFDALMENATINNRGEKEIPFMDHEIEDVLLYKIIDKYAKQLKPKWERRRFKNSILLGCSPKTKYHE